MDFDQRYAERTRRSAELFADASKIVPGGAGSSARTVKFGWKPYPPFNAGLAVKVDGIGTVFLRGGLFHPSQYENLFVSLVHTDADIDQTLTAAEESFKVLAAAAV
jgi:glutamate-1-semialdehyde aminotransferase